MAKAKKPATSRSEGGKKNPKRVAAGKRRWRKLVAELGSAEAAREYLFGAKGKATKAKKKAKAKKAKAAKAKAKTSRSVGGKGKAKSKAAAVKAKAKKAKRARNGLTGYIEQRTFEEALKAVKYGLGTSQLPATLSEIAQARTIMRRGVTFAGPQRSLEERAKEEAAKRLKAEKRKEALRIIAARQKEREALEREEERKAAEAEIEKLAEKLD